MWEPRQRRGGAYKSFFLEPCIVFGKIKGKVREETQGEPILTGEPFGD